MNLTTLFTTLVRKFKGLKLSAEEVETIVRTQQILDRYYENLNKAPDRQLARRTWLQMNNQQSRIQALLADSSVPETLFALGSDLQKCKGRLRSDYNF